VRVIQRCSEWLPNSLDPWLQDPARVQLVHHADGIQISPGMARVYKNQVEHDPLDIHRAREIASGTEIIPVGILYRNPDVPCYEDTRKSGALRTVEAIRKNFETELDKYSV
jgi:2-oxoglutarate ferredoxin oxidoreductase subunit beta